MCASVRVCEEKRGCPHCPHDPRAPYSVLRAPCSVGTSDTSLRRSGLHPADFPG
ncbi:MAG: hypothetical protein ACLU17_05950 [Phocaeicola vulgatus]